MKPNEFRKIIDSGKIPPVVFFVGSDDYLARDAIDALKAKVLDAGNPMSAAESWDGKEQAVGDVLASAEQFAFGGGRKLLVISHAEAFLSEDALEAYVANPCPTSVLVFCLEKLDGRKKLAKTIESSCALVDIGEQYEDEHGAEIARLLRQYPQLKFHPEALACLKDWVGGDLAALQAELEKISVALPEKALIEAADIESLVFKQRDNDIFALADAIAVRDKKQSLELLVRLMREEGKSAPEIFGLLRSQAERLYQAAEMLAEGKPGHAICQALRVPSFFCDRFLAKAKKAKGLSPRRFFTLLAEYDKSVKTGLLKESLAAEMLTLKLCG